MNFLAHIYLSGEDEGVKIGNFIGDYVKGKGYLDYPDNISKGIILHRYIDSFTDSHPMVKAAMQPLRPGYGRYSGIVVDIIFDHFLAKHWDNFSSHQLHDFIHNAHAIFLSNFRLLPWRVKQFLPFLIQNRRLASYSSKKGVRRTLALMSKYTSLPSKSDFAIQVLEKDETLLQEYFYSFMEDVVIYVENEFSIKVSKPSGQPMPANYEAV